MSMLKFYILLACIVLPLLTLNIAYGKQSDSTIANELYLTRCAHCHGELGKGDGSSSFILYPKPPDFTNRDYMKFKTDNDLENTITYGRGSMPSFKNILVKEEIDIIVKRLRSF